MKHKMKAIVSALILTATVGPTHAEGFYQKIVGDTPGSERESDRHAGQFDYSPLYLRVVGGSDRSSAHGTQVPDFGYTPLYDQVTARADRTDGV